MILESISLENWRSFRDRRTFSFDPGLNVVAGENEAGKSTLFEALWRGFFDRHTSAAAEIRGIQPEGTSLGPEVTIVFTAAGRRQKLSKRFLSGAFSRLYEDRGGDFVLTAEGDLADAAVVEMAGGTGSGSGASKVLHRGAAQALWYLQREDPLPEDQWNEAVRDGLSSIIQSVSTTPEEERVERMVEKDYLELFTAKTGVIREGTELRAAEHRRDEVAAELAGLRSKRERLQAERVSLESMNASLDELGRERAAAAGERERAIADVLAGEEIDRKLSELTAESERRRQEYSRLAERAEEIEARIAEIRELGEAVESAKGEMVGAEVERRTSLTMKERAHAGWQGRLEPELKSIDRSLRAFRSLERRRKLEKDREHLESYIQRVESEEKEIESLRSLLRGLNAPDEEVWSSYTDAEASLRVAEAELRSNSIRVTFRLPEGRQIVPDPRTDPVAGEYRVERPTTFRIEGIGEVEIRGGGRSLEEARAEEEKSRSAVSGILERYQAGSTAELASLLERRRNAEKSLAAAEAALNMLATERPDARVEYAKVLQGIEEESSAAAAVPDEFTHAGGRKIREEIDALEARKEDAIARIEKLQAEEQEAAEVERDQSLRLAELGREVAKFNERMGVLAEMNARQLSEFGTMKQLRDRVEAEDKAARAVDGELAALRADYREKVVRPGERLKEAERRMSALDAGERELEREIAAKRALIESGASDNLYSRHADLEAEQDYIAGRITTLRRRANALRLLRELIGERRRAATAELTRPVSDMVGSWFETVTGGRYGGVEMDEHLMPTGAVGAGGWGMPLKKLSHGTQEQLVVLVRLALGVLMSGEERNLVVLDDSLVNADALRRRRMNEILADASQRCQILLATCNPSNYAGSPCRIVQVPGSAAEQGTGSAPGPGHATGSEKSL